MDIAISLPIKDETLLPKLTIGDKIRVNGELFLFRDQVHKKIAENDTDQLDSINFLGSGVYYCAPTPVKEGFLIGSFGPTSSYRMDKYTEYVLKLGFKVMIGKGYRSDDIALLCKKYNAIYVITYGGCGALLNQYVKEVKLLAYQNLGTEAMQRVLVKDFPGYVAIDTFGNKLWK